MTAHTMPEPSSAPRRQHQVRSVGMFYAAFPPEVNSGRMYAGPGSGPMRAAAAAWDGLAGELQSAAASYSSVISSLTGGAWPGPSSLNMAAAVTPYLTWMQATAAQAGRDREPGHRCGKRLRDCVRGPRATGGDRGQPQPAGVAGGDQHIRAEHRGDRGHRNPIRRNVGPGRRGDGYYAGSSAAASELTPFTPAPQVTNRAGWPARQPRSPTPQPPRPARAQSLASTEPTTRTPVLQWLANLSTEYTDTIDGLLNALFGPNGASTFRRCSPRSKLHWLYHRVQRLRTVDQLSRVAVSQVTPAPGLAIPKEGLGGGLTGPGGAGAG